MTDDKSFIDTTHRCEQNCCTQPPPDKIKFCNPVDPERQAQPDENIYVMSQQASLEQKDEEDDYQQTSEFPKSQNQSMTMENRDDKIGSQFSSKEDYYNPYQS